MICSLFPEDILSTFQPFSNQLVYIVMPNNTDLPITDTSTTINWHALTIQKSLEKLVTNDKGLDNSQVEKRISRYGLNQFTITEEVSALKIFLSQFHNFLIYLLSGASILSFIIGEIFDGLAIFTILVLNAILGFFQEYKAEKALQELKKLETPITKVKRGNKIITIESKNLVPGDILILSEGDKISADARILESYSLEVDESSLTGESVPVSKFTKTLPKDTNLPDAINLVFSGTIVTKGKGSAMVFATGDKTQFGKIANLVQTAEEQKTPLQKTLERLGIILGLISLAVALPALIIGLLTGRDVLEMVMLSVSLAVSAIPEGLPVVVTLALAIGTRKLLKKKVLIRKLPAVETLGSVDTICTDKTGTLTENKMTVTRIITATDDLKKFNLEKNFNSIPKKINLRLLAQASQLCNDATPESGDPTEVALMKMSQKLKIDTQIRQEYQRINEIPFSSNQKFMVTLNQVDSQKIAFIKGAPEIVLKMTDRIQMANNSKKISSPEKEEIQKQIKKLSAEGLRVLALGYKVVENNKEFNKLDSYVFLGLVGMIDPPRKNVTKSLAKALKAGVRVMMITGDHPLTAENIAQQIGITSEKVITGEDLDHMSRQELENCVQETNIFARVSPQNKLQILQALHNHGHHVAMTGDGVNDAPALKEADIGIAVGDGTDLAKEVADMIILDNDFSSIIAAMSEARGIFFNIKKFVIFLLAANFDEIFVILAAIVLETPLPLLPIHLLWLNVITDSLPALALSVDNYDPDVMDRPPYDPKKEIISHVFNFSLAAGILGFLATFFMFVTEIRYHYSSVALAQTLTFTTTVLFELWLVFSVRSQTNAFKAGIFSNKWLIRAIGASIILQLIAIYLPFTQQMFKTVPFALSYWPKVIAYSMSGFVIIELIRGIKYGHLVKYIDKNIKTLRDIIGNFRS